jgi:elongation factor Tu
MVKINEDVELVGINEEPTKTVVTGIEMFNKQLTEGRAGDNAGLLIRYQKEDVEREWCLLSQVLSPSHRS